MTRKKNSFEIKLYCFKLIEKNIYVQTINNIIIE